jgi:hypothetical protein
MSQHYPNPHDVAVPPTTPYPTRHHRAIIARDGLITPILVKTMPKIGSDGVNRPYFVAADRIQGERVLACRELGWDSILVETSWTNDDL